MPRIAISKNKDNDGYLVIKCPDSFGPGPKPKSFNNLGALKETLKNCGIPVNLIPQQDFDTLQPIELQELPEGIIKCILT